jgi:starch-binding outer membrane protein, SusD/RagB family
MKKITYILILAVLLSSCKKFLQEEPYNQIALQDIFKDFEGARTTLVGCYDQLRESNYYLRDMSVFADMAGGNIKHARAGNQFQLETYRFQNAPLNTLNNMTGFYVTAYNLLYRCNSIIENVNRVQDADSSKKNRMLADAHAIKAMVHFDLVRVFAQAPNFSSNANHTGIILRRVNTPVIEPQGTPATVKEVYDEVIADAVKAMQFYRNSVDIYDGDTKFWLSENAVKAFLSRVHLYNKQWQQTVTYSTELINSNLYPLISNAAYNTAWRGKTKLSESVFELAYGNRVGGALGEYYNPASTLAQLAATDDLLNMFDANDVRSKNSMYISGVIESKTWFFTKKYLGIRDTANNIRVFRLSEIILNRAEAYAELNDLPNALLDLNRIRKRGNPLAVDFVSTDKDAIINEILNERRRELCFEGHLFFDLSRRGRNIVRTDCTGLNCTITYPDAKYAVPVPLF